MTRRSDPFWTVLVFNLSRFVFGDSALSLERVVAEWLGDRLRALRTDKTSIRDLWTVFIVFTT